MAAPSYVPAPVVRATERTYTGPRRRLGAWRAGRPGEVVDQGGQVDQLDDGGHGGVLVGGVAGGLAGEQHQPAPQLLAPEAAHVGGHVADGGGVLPELGEQHLAHALHALLHRPQQPG